MHLAQKLRDGFNRAGPHFAVEMVINEGHRFRYPDKRDQLWCQFGVSKMRQGFRLDRPVVWEKRRVCLREHFADKIFVIVRKPPEPVGSPACKRTESRVFLCKTCINKCLSQNLWRRLVNGAICEMSQNLPPVACVLRTLAQVNEGQNHQTGFMWSVHAGQRQKPQEFLRHRMSPKWFALYHCGPQPRGHRPRLTEN